MFVSAVAKDSCVQEVRLAHLISVMGLTTMLIVTLTNSK